MHTTLSVAIGIAVCLLPGCSKSAEQEAKDRFVRQARVAVKPSVLEEYAGTYRLPSGALFRIFHESGRLMAGTPPFELLPQTTREFASNRIPARITFDRGDDGRVHRLNYSLAKRDLWIDRVNEQTAVDPTVLVDAGGPRLRMLITGTGDPTVVIDDGFGASIEARSEMQARLSQFVRVVTYDHAGTGGSEAGPEPRHARQTATELHTALANAGIEPPYLLVGGSIGGDYIRVVAHEYPQDVAGLVLLDPTPDWDAMLDWMKVHSSAQARTYSDMVTLAETAGDTMMSFQERGRQLEWAAKETTRLQAKEAFPPSTLPVTVLIGAQGHLTHVTGRDKVRFFQDWQQEHLPHARLVLAEKSGHAIFAAEPHLVVREIRRLVEAVRRGDE